MHETRTVKQTVEFEVRDVSCFVCGEVVYVEQLEGAKWRRHSVEHPHIKLSFELHTFRDEKSNAPGTPFSECGRSELNPRMCIGCVLDERGLEAALGRVFPQYEFSAYGRGSVKKKRLEPPDNDKRKRLTGPDDDGGEDNEK